MESKKRLKENQREIISLKERISVLEDYINSLKDLEWEKEYPEGVLTTTTRYLGRSPLGSCNIIYAPNRKDEYNLGIINCNTSFEISKFEKNDSLSVIELEVKYVNSEGKIFFERYFIHTYQKSVLKVRHWRDAADDNQKEEK